MFDILEKGVLYEYTGTVTQLAATSEVATIGFKLAVPAGERVLVNFGRVVASDIAAGKLTQTYMYTSLDVIFQHLGSASLDNSAILLGGQKMHSAATANTASDVGFPWLPILGGGQYLSVVCTATLDALATLKLYLSYLSRRTPLTVTAV